MLRGLLPLDRGLLRRRIWQLQSGAISIYTLASSYSHVVVAYFNIPLRSLKKRDSGAQLLICNRSILLKSQLLSFRELANVDFWCRHGEGGVLGQKTAYKTMTEERRG